MKTKYNKSEIMKSAWETFKNYNGEVSFSDCLKMEWKQSKVKKQIDDNFYSKVYSEMNTTYIVGNISANFMYGYK